MVTPPSVFTTFVNSCFRQKEYTSFSGIFIQAAPTTFLDCRSCLYVFMKLKSPLRLTDFVSATVSSKVLCATFPRILISLFSADTRMTALPAACFLVLLLRLRSHFPSSHIPKMNFTIFCAKIISICIRLLHFVYIRIPVTVFYVQRAPVFLQKQLPNHSPLPKTPVCFDTANVQISIQTGDLYLITGQISGLDVTVFRRKYSGQFRSSPPF